MEFVAFRLFAPLASFGDVAVGERRPSLPSPTRSMVLGLVAACLGIRRGEYDLQARLECSLGVATRTDAPGSLLVDYHTAQSPDGPRRKAFTRHRGRNIATRFEEVSATSDRDGSHHELGTQLSLREYRTDGMFVVVIWERLPGSPWGVGTVAEHLRRPRFAPFAGRKSAVFAAPFEPSIIEAADPVAALRSARFSTDGLLERLTRRSRERVYRWSDWPDLTADRAEVRRDRVLSRERWQFVTREEMVLVETRTEGARDVPDPD